MQQMSNTGFCSFLSLLLSSKLKKFFGKTAWCCCLWMPLESFHNFYSQTNAHMYVRSYKYIIVQRKLCRGLAEANNCCLLLFGFSLCYLLNSSAKEKRLLLHLHCARPRPPNAAGIIWHLIGSCIAAWKSREMRENSARTAHLSSSSLSALKSRLLLNFRLLFFWRSLSRYLSRMRTRIRRTQANLYFPLVFFFYQPSEIYLRAFFFPQHGFNDFSMFKWHKFSTPRGWE